MTDTSDTAASPRLKPATAGFERMGPVNVFRNEKLLSDSDRKELEFWEHDPGEGPDSDIFENVIYKSRVMLTFRRALEFLNLSGDERVLEVGSGQGWASAMLKRKFPNCYVVASDVSPHALQMAEKYEKLIGATIDEKWASHASSLPFADSQIDVVFCFAAFHHFIIGDRYTTTLNEMLRVLRLAAIDEDVLQLGRLSEESARFGATFEYEYFADYQDRLLPTIWS